jgi:hypothetical protein
MIPLPLDAGDNVIQGISGIPFVDTFTAPAGTWVPIILHTEESKSILVQPRDILTWRFATTSGSDKYFSMRNGAVLKAPVVTTSGTTICWAYSDTSTVFELLVGR